MSELDDNTVESVAEGTPIPADAANVKAEDMAEQIPNTSGQTVEDLEKHITVLLKGLADSQQYTAKQREDALMRLAAVAQDHSDELSEDSDVEDEDDDEDWDDEDEDDDE